MIKAFDDGHMSIYRDNNGDSYMASHFEGLTIVRDNQGHSEYIVDCTGGNNGRDRRDTFGSGFYN